MDRFRLIQTVLLLVAPSAFFAANVVGAAKPNIVVIFIDDLGYADIGPYGATKQKTPHLDRMAKEGMKLTSFYAAPVCSVSRAQLMTGCYGVRVSVPGVFGPANQNGLHPSEFTIAERLKEQGYATACVGKWHLGDQPEFLPTRQGFDRYFGIPYSNDMQRKATASGEKVVPLLRDDQVIELLTDEQQSRIVARYTDEATRFIREHKSQPFFLYLPHTAVHTPIWPGEAFRGRSANGRFGDWVEEVDWSVGRIFETLQEQKLDEQTLVIFTSDNGPWLIKGNDGGSALPLRGGKGSTWEGGVRVPTLARWPGKISAGSSCDAVAGTIDLLPTFVALAGGRVPESPVIDGKDIAPLLLGKTQSSPRDVHYYFSGLNLQAVRQGAWKLALQAQVETMGKGTSDDASTVPRLYNLDQDIGEKTNLADKHPDIVAKLTAFAETKNAEIGGKDPTARRPAGLVTNPQPLYPSEGKQRPEKKGAKNKGKKAKSLTAAAANQSQADGFIDVFDGKTLQNWEGDPQYWSVEDGALTGVTDGSLKMNRFITWKGGSVRNFELRVQVKVTAGGNSGLQYRGSMLPEVGPDIVMGYQCDVVANTPDYNGMLYEERGRRILAHTGEKVIIDPQGQPWVIDTMPVKVFKPDQWHEYRVLVEGNHHRHWIDDHPTADLIDLDEKGRALAGVLAVQVHVGPAMKIQYKDFKLKHLPDDLPLKKPEDCPIPDHAYGVKPQGKLPPNWKAPVYKDR